MLKELRHWWTNLEKCVREQSFKTDLVNLIRNYNGKTHSLTAVLVRQCTVWNAAPGQGLLQVTKTVIMEIIGKQEKAS